MLRGRLSRSSLPCARMQEVPFLGVTLRPAHSGLGRAPYPPTNKLLPTSVISPNSVALGQTVLAQLGPKILGMLGPRPLKLGMSDPLETHSCPMCNHTKFRHSNSNHLAVCRGPKMGTLGPSPWDGEVACPPKICFSPPHLCQRAKFDHSGSNRPSVMEICQKILTSHAPLFRVTQGLKPTQMRGNFLHSRPRLLTRDLFAVTNLLAYIGKLQAYIIYLFIYLFIYLIRQMAANSEIHNEHKSQ